MKNIRSWSRWVLSLTFLAAASVAFGTCTTAPSGLVSWWPGESNATDVAGSNNGVLVGGLSFTDGKVGQGFFFNDTNQEVRIAASSNIDLGLGGGLTLEAWINPQDVTRFNPIFEWNVGDGVTYWGVHFYVLTTGPSGDGTLYADVQSVEDGWHQIYSNPGVVTNNSFQHVALTYDKASGMARMYYNGGLVAQRAFGSFTPKTTGDLHLGRRPTDPADTKLSFLGIIDEPAIYNRALASNEIAAIYSAGTAGKCPPGPASTPPSIIGQPTNQTVSVGGFATFVVNATGSPTLHYQWFGPSGSISNATSPILTLTNIQPGNAGAYFAFVTNLYGFATSSNAILTVTGGTSNTPPSIIGQPTNQTVSVGGFATFVVNATGSDPLHYQWFGPSGSISNATGPILTLTNIQLSAAGAYHALVSNSFGSTNSADAILTVTSASSGTGLIVPNYSATNQIHASAGTFNEILRLQMVYGASEFPPYPIVISEIRWRPDQDAGGALSITVSNLQIRLSTTKAQPDHLSSTFSQNTGTNETVVFNGTLNISSAFTTLSNGTKAFDITVPLQTPFLYDASKGNLLLDLHNFSGSTPPRGNFASVAGGADATSRVFAFNPNATNAAVADTGGDVLEIIYSAAGGTSNTPPSIVGQPTNQTVSVGGFATFVANATGSDPLHYQWFGPSGSISNATSPILTLTNIQLSAAGAYHALVTNLYGFATSSNAILTVTGGTSNTPPSIIGQPTNQTVSVGGFATFVVNATGTAPLHYQWFGPSGSISNATSPILTLTNIQLSAAGAYHALVTNLYGFATSSNAILTVNGGSGSCTPSPSGIVSWWPGEGSGNDIAGSNTAILESGVTFADGEVGQGFQLQNPTNAFMHVPTSPSLNIGKSNGLTIEGWINVSSVSGLHPIVEWYGDARNKVGVQLWLNSTPYQNGALMGALVDTNFNPHQLVSSNDIIIPNVFQHVALTYDRASGLGTLYLNGAIVAQANFGSFVPQTTYDMWIGHRPFDVPGDWTYGTYLGGILDELSLYNRALNQGEIAAIYNAGSAGKCHSAATPLLITSQPTNQTVSVGGTASFSVGASGTPPLHYLWSGPSGSISNATNATLTLTNVQSGNAGSYHVVVSDAHGSVTSSNALLTVRPSITTLTVASATVTGGSSFDVPIALVAIGSENAFSFTLRFDPARLVYSNIALGSGAGDAFLLPNTVNAGSGIIGIQLALPSGETFNAGTQEVIRVTFSAPILTGTQSVITAVNFTNQPIAELVSDVQGHSLSNAFVNGTVTVLPAPIEGDALPATAGDGIVDVFDWVQVGRYVAGLDTITNGPGFQRVDCAPRDTLGDGQLKVTDWVQAGRYAAGLDPLTLAGGPEGLVTPNLVKALSSSPNGRQITVNSGSAVKGLTMTLPINLQAQGDETAMAFSLNFDPSVLRYVSAVKGSAVSSAILNVNSNQAASGKIAIVLCLPTVGTHFVAGTKEIAKVTFMAIATTTNNSVSFADQPVPRSISDTNAVELPANYVGNSVVVNPQPRVGMSNTGGTSLLSWPVWAGDFTLQAAGSLTPPVTWTNFPATLRTNGDNIEIILPSQDRQIFFQLVHKPD